jgi:N-6 DNA Methylase
VVLALHDRRLQWWAQESRAPRLLETVPEGNLLQFFARHRDDLRPEAIFRAKTRGLFEPGLQLSFVDVGLMPILEAEMGEQLSALVERATDAATTKLGSSGVSNEFLQSVFWLLAAKILGDKQVPGFEEVEFGDIRGVLDRVARHYNAGRNVGKASRRVLAALESAGDVFARFSSLRHVSPEALASVYESSLVSKETRAKLGIHSTPSFLTRYIVWRLAPWVEEIPLEKRHVFEPTCGQGAFLVAAMRLLRDLLPAGTGSEIRKVYLREHLHGDDLDPFAIELARLSLTLADIPNPDGWDLRTTDIFRGSSLEDRARNSMIVLANPPFEAFSKAEREALSKAGREAPTTSKATELLRRLLPVLSPGGVFGMVVPQGILHARSARALRQTLLDDFEVGEITLLPDGVFTFSDAETAILVGRRRVATPAGRTVPARYQRVREHQLEQFRSSYTGASLESFEIPRGLRDPNRSLFVPELAELWAELQHAARLGDIAEIGKGLEFTNPVPAGIRAFSTKPFPGSTAGFLRFGRDISLHELPTELWFNLDPSVIRRPGSGTITCAPQVLLNYAPVSRGPWRLKALLDPTGHAVSSRFLTIRPKRTDLSLNFLWGLLNSPVANAFMFAHTSKRDNLKGTLEGFPVPRVSGEAARKVAAAARRYLATVSQLDSGPLFAAPASDSARDFLLAVDAEVLRLYDLPPRLERKLLDLFDGQERLGVPFKFDRYFPADFKPWIPLHSFLSPEYQRSTAGNLRRPGDPAPKSVVAALQAAVEAFED